MNLSADDLAGMRATATALLPDTCYIVRPTPVADQSGGWTETPAQTGPWPCAFVPFSTTEGPRGAGTQIAALATAQVALPAETDVLDTDQIVVHLGGLDVDVITCDVVQVARRSTETRRLCQVQELHPS